MSAQIHKEIKKILTTDGYGELELLPFVEPQTLSPGKGEATIELLQGQIKVKKYGRVFEIRASKLGGYEAVIEDSQEYRVHRHTTLLDLLQRLRAKG